MFGRFTLSASRGTIKPLKDTIHVQRGIRGLATPSNDIKGNFLSQAAQATRVSHGPATFTIRV